MRTKLMLFALGAAMLVGCAHTKHPLTQPRKQRIASRILAIEGAYWDRSEERRLLDKLENDIAVAIGTPGADKLEQALQRIDETILQDGYKIAAHRSHTLGDSLAARTLDCSDLTLVYLQALERARISALPFFSREHVLIYAQTTEGSLLWETTSGKVTTKQRVRKRDGIVSESIAAGVYLVPRPVESLLGNAYAEIGLKLKFEGANRETVESVLRKAVEEDPLSVTALQDLVAFLCQQNRFDEAGTLLQKATVLDPPNPASRDLREWIGLMKSATRFSGSKTRGGRDSGRRFLIVHNLRPASSRAARYNRYINNVIFILNEASTTS